MSAKIIIALSVFTLSSSLPLGKNSEENSLDYEGRLDTVLGNIFDRFVKPESKYAEKFEEEEKVEEPQKDMPNSDIILDNVALKIFLPISNKTNINSTMFNNTKTSNMSFDFHKQRQRTRKNWIDIIKNNILHGTGRKNDTTGTLSPELLEQVRNSLNRSVGGFPFGKIQDVENATTENPSETEYVEKIRSFYPSCDVPRNTDEEMWNDVNTMNLFFTVDYSSQNNEVVNIASATLRLYKLPQEYNTTAQENCKDAQYLSDDDKQIRVSVYWYSRSLKKHKAVKRRLADSRMVPLIEKHTSNYVEFNIRPATKAWVRGRNLGLGVVVEDMDGAILSADKYFRDIGCQTVGNVSTPKPIPTLVVDALRSGFRVPFNGSNAASDVYNSFMPIIDICTIELPLNLTGSGEEGTEGTTVACKHLRSNDKQTKKLFGDVKLGSLSEVLTGRHIRHQRQHQKESDSSDPRNKMISRRLVITNHELQEYNDFFSKNQNNR